MHYQTLLLQREDGVATITFNNPEKMNLIFPQFLSDMATVIGEVGQDKDVRAVIITGAGKAFSAGGEIDDMIRLSQHPSDCLRQARFASNDIIAAMRNMPKPLIAAVNGPAVGGGLCFALASDIIIAAEEAKFGTGYARIGIHTDLGTAYLLPRLIGPARACELIFTARIIDSREADKIGLVNQVVPGEQLLRTARDLATRLANGPINTIGLMKSTLYQSLSMDMSSAFELEARTAAFCIATEEAREGINAFLEKRKPVFKGK